MTKRTVKEWIVRSLILLVGLTIAHLGVTLFLKSNLGADPFNVLVQGIYMKFDAVMPAGLMTHGRTHMAICFIIILILLVTDRTYIKIGTVLCMFCGGPIIDFFSWIFKFIFPDDMNMVGRVIMLVAGCIILAYGMTIVIKSDAGTGTNDLVGVVISDKLGKKFSIIRLIVDAAFTVTGILLGGIAGFGTLICIVLVGPVAGLFLPINGRLVDKIVGEKK